MNICTIVAKNYLAHARVLAESFQREHPGGECCVLVIDEVDGYLDAAAEPFTLVRPEDVELEAFDEMRGAYDVMELSTAVKPWLLRYMLRNHDDGGGVAYMDPDILVTSRMLELEGALRDHAVVLTPHVLSGMPRDGRKPTETDILMAGVYNLGFIGLSNREDAHTVLDWWSERLLTDCHVAPERGLFVDQRWVDFVPGLVSDLEILRNPAYNVAYWNLPERTLGRSNGGYTVNDLPLRFFHFSGYCPDRRTDLSKHQDRVRLTKDPTLWALCDAYGDALVAAGRDEVRAFPYEHDVLPSGLRLTRTMRSLYRTGVEAGECPESIFTPAGEADFVGWLNERSPAAPRLSRFLYAVWSEREDLKRTYRDVEQGDVTGFIGWCGVYGRKEINLPDVLLPKEALRRAPVEADSAPEGEQPAQETPARHPFGVNVAGYLRSELGIGEVARQIISALDAAGVPALPVGLFAPNSRQGHSYVAGEHDHNPFRVNIVCINADGLPRFAEEVGEGFFEDHYTIGVWWWETSDFPPHYANAFRYVDEVWVGSRFVAQAVIDAPSPVPVIPVPIPVRFAEPPPLLPGEYGWPDAFTYLFSWDYCSVFKRKNPLAVIEAYTAAFDEGAGTALVLKCINDGYDPIGHRKVQEAIAGRDDIVLIDDYLDPGDKDRLMRSCDCYVSLHRSEGLGLTMAEAMFHRKPVIATGYSGNTDFATAENSYPVGYRLVPIGSDASPYPAEGVWAEPDVAEAARLMRRVFEDREDAAARAARAAEDIRSQFSPAAAGEVMRGRLERIAARAPAPRHDPEVCPELRETRQLVRRAAKPDRRSRFGKPGGAVRRLALRAMRPYTAYQQQVNESVERALSSLAAASAVDPQIEQLAVRLAESHATLLGQVREQRTRIVELSATVAAEHATRERSIEAPTRLVAETRALPYMSADVFRVFDAGAAGSVLGYDAPPTPEQQGGYRQFEQLFRGEESFVARRQRRYLELIGDCAPVVDVGCGRGEFLDLLAEAGIAATGVDADADMVEHCRGKGHTGTVHGDGVAYLEGLEDGSLGLVFSAQVIEHLPAESLKRLIEVATRKLRPGGLLVAETVNPHSAAALKAFWVDVTHRHPLFPEAMLALCRIAGFASAYVFHPDGVGDVDADRYTTGEYAVVARR